MIKFFSLFVLFIAVTSDPHVVNGGSNNYVHTNSVGQQYVLSPSGSNVPVITNSLGQQYIVVGGSNVYVQK